MSFHPINSSSPSSQQQVYQDYISYYDYITAQIGTLQQLLAGLQPGSAKYVATQNAISQLEVILTGPLQQDYEVDYATGDSTDFESDWNTKLKPEIDAIVNSVIPPLSPNAQKINNDYTEAQALLQAILAALSQDQSAYSSLQAQISQWESTIAQLQGKITGSKDPAKAQADLNAAENQLASLEAQAKQMEGDLTTLTQAQTEINELQAFAQETNPSDADVTQADALLASIQGQINNHTFANAQTDFTTNDPTGAEMAAMNTAILTVEQDVGPVTVQGQTAYIDISAMNGMSAASIQTIIDDLKATGITQIDLSFAQLSDPTSWPAGGSATFQQVIADAHAAGMKVDLSFGGANGATAGNWSVDNPAALTAQLAAFVKANGIDGLDFDYEYTAGPLPAPYQANLLTFFEDFHAQMSPLNIPMTLTVMAGPSNSAGTPDGSGGVGNGPITDLFQNFSACFDGLNLMMYGGPEYLTGNPNYLEMWLGTKGQNNGIINQFGIPIQDIHVGFMDYKEGDPSGYPGTGTQGQNAANAYLAALAALGYTPSELGTTFWWPNEGVIDPSGQGYIGVIEALEEILDEYNGVNPQAIGSAALIV